MKRFLLSTAAVALMSATAVAADLPVFEPPPEMVAPAPIASNWSGFYIGIHGGYGWANFESGDDDFDFDDDGEDDFFGDADLEGGVVGGQLGYNVQFNNFVVGLEGDASYTFIDNDDDSFDDDGVGLNSEVEFLASVRGRAGLAFNRFMVYGTGGVAFADFGTEFDGGDFFDDDDDDDSEIEVGYVFGGGAEFLATDNVSLGIEYLHYEFEDLDTENLDFVAIGGGDAFDPDIETDVDVIRGRVNVKFGGLFGG